MKALSAAAASHQMSFDDLIRQREKVDGRNGVGIVAAAHSGAPSASSGFAACPAGRVNILSSHEKRSKQSDLLGAR